MTFEDLCANFEACIERAARGEEFVIMVNGHPMARLAPLEAASLPAVGPPVAENPSSGHRRLDFLAGQIWASEELAAASNLDPSQVRR